MKHRTKGLLVPLVWLALGACDERPGSPTTPESPLDTVVSSIRVLPTERTIGVLGTTFAVGAAALNGKGDVLYGSTLSPGRFTWSSSAPNVAPIDEGTLLVMGVEAGTATVSASTQGISGSMTVSVYDRAELAWSTPLTSSGVTFGALALGADGTIYVGSDDFGLQRSIWHAVSPSGTVLWTLQLAITWPSAPAIAEDGTLYFGSHASEGALTAVRPEGSVSWTLSGLGDIYSSVAIGPDGTIYAAGERSVYAVSPQGEIQWTYEAPDDAFRYSSPAIGSDGTVYVGGIDGALYAIDPDGSLAWTFGTGKLIQASPTIGADGTIYVASMDGSLYAVAQNGQEQWRVAVDFRGVQSSPSVGPDGTIYVGGAGVYAVDPSGSIRWSFPGSQVRTTPILGANGTVYVGAPGGVGALDRDGRLLWDLALGGSLQGSPAIGVDGLIIATTYTLADGVTAHSIREHGGSNGGYDGSPWPTARRVRANTARAGG